MRNHYVGHFYITREEQAAFERLCAEEDRSFAGMVRLLVVRELKARGHLEKEHRTRRQRK